LSAISKIEHNTTQTVKVQLNKVIPTNVGGYEITRVLIILAILLLLGQVNAFREKIRLSDIYEQYERKLKHMTKTAVETNDTNAIESLKEDMGEIKNLSGQKRKELILHLMDVQKKLESFKRMLTFLSIDVVGSTAMKSDEDPIAISADFYRYNELADKILAENNALKVAKTPDGIMAAFENTDQAVLAGQQLINQLDHFNKFVKKMKGDFNIRCGINSGMLYFDPNEPLENISDRVIDIAGHMQKEAEPNTINIAKSSIAPLVQIGGFTNAEKLIDEQIVYTWKLK
jgi:hypothetical protein